MLVDHSQFKVINGDNVLSSMSSMPKESGADEKDSDNGGAGFIGSALVRYIINETSERWWWSIS